MECAMFIFASKDKFKIETAHRQMSGFRFMKQAYEFYGSSINRSVLELSTISSSSGPSAWYSGMAITFSYVNSSTARQSHCRSMMRVFEYLRHQ